MLGAVNHSQATGLLSIGPLHRRVFLSARFLSVEPLHRQVFLSTRLVSIEPLHRRRLFPVHKVGWVNSVTGIYLLSVHFLHIKKEGKTELLKQKLTWLHFSIFPGNTTELCNLDFCCHIPCIAYVWLLTHSDDGLGMAFPSAFSPNVSVVPLEVQVNSTENRWKCFPYI